MYNNVSETVQSLKDYLGDIRNENISESADAQRKFCSSNTFIDGLGVTILNHSYLHSLILGEVKKGDVVQLYQVDGNQRVGALMLIRYGNYKFGSKIEDSVIPYQRKVKDENGKIVRDEKGDPVWEKAEFDIAKKTFADLPEELQRQFDTFQVKVATHRDCTMADISKLIRKYNSGTSMNASQKSFTYLDMYARKVKTIAATDFFNESTSLTENQNKKGVWESIVMRAMMTVFHLDDWKKSAKDMAVFLNHNASDMEFDLFQDMANSLCDVCGDAYKKLFNVKNIPIWFAAYDHFLKLGIENIKFRKFLDAFQENLHMSPVECEYDFKKLEGNITWDKLDEQSGTTDGSLVKAKIDTLCQLIDEFFSIEKTEKTETEPVVEENNNTVEETNEVEIDPVLKFAQDNVRDTIEPEDIALYKDFLSDFVKDESPIYKAGEETVIALMAYATDIEKDAEFSEWIDRENSKNNTYSTSHKTNFTYLKRDFDEFLEKENGGKAA